MKKTLKVVIIAVFAVMLLAPMASAIPAHASGLNLGTEYGAGIGLGNRDPRDIAADLIRVILGFLGILAVVIILVGGFKWMTAGGNEDQVAEARKIIVAGIIGLVIILAAWGIANFVIGSILGATSDVAP